MQRKNEFRYDTEAAAMASAVTAPLLMLLGMGFFSYDQISSDAESLVVRCRRAPKIIRSVRDWSPSVYLVGFKLLSDVDHKVVAEYGSTQKFGANEVAARNTFLVDPNGVIRKEYIKVDPNPHSKEVIAALTDLEKK